jgi:hypothetical protein
MRAAGNRQRRAAREGDSARHHAAARLSGLRRVAVLQLRTRHVVLRGLYTRQEPLHFPQLHQHAPRRCLRRGQRLADGEQSTVLSSRSKSENSHNLQHPKRPPTSKTTSPSPCPCLRTHVPILRNRVGRGDRTSRCRAGARVAASMLRVLHSDPIFLSCLVLEREPEPSNARRTWMTFERGASTKSTISPPSCCSPQTSRLQSRFRHRRIPRCRARGMSDAGRGGGGVHGLW